MLGKEVNKNAFLNSNFSRAVLDGDYSSFFEVGFFEENYDDLKRQQRRVVWCLASVLSAVTLYLDTKLKILPR